jgi:ribosomal protein L16 Arg81 hydroxylase
MIQKMYGLEYLISPYSFSEFMTSFSGEKSLHIFGHPRKFTDLFGMKDVDYFIKQVPLNYPKTLLAIEKQVLSETALDDIDHWLGQGATLIVAQVQQWHPKVSEFAEALYNDVKTKVQVNCYYAPLANKQGFDCHYDDYDVFILQIHGKKSWTVFDPTIKFPPTGDNKILSLPKDPYLECVLSEGDVLYIPKGHWHYAIAIEPCIHLTVGILSKTSIDFLRWIIDEIANENELFCQDIPIAWTQKTGETSNRNIVAHLEQLSKKAREKLIEKIQDKKTVDKFLEYYTINNETEMKTLHRILFSKTRRH